MLVEYCKSGIECVWVSGFFLWHTVHDTHLFPVAKKLYLVYQLIFLQGKHLVFSNQINHKHKDKHNQKHSILTVTLLNQNSF